MSELRARQDGFGTRRIEHDQRHGAVEILDVASLLATAAAEQAITVRAAYLSEVGTGVVAPVYAIDRDQSGLHVTAGAVDGAPLCAVLSALEAGTLRLADEAILDVAAAVVHAVAALHELPAAVAHGAVSPVHVVLTRQGRAMLTDGVFGCALEALQCNRERYWREFGLALPPAASLPRFDRRTDVTQLGATVLALALRRALRADEYPGRLADLVIAATPDTNGRTSPLRMWLQQTLQLHPRENFGSAAEAEPALLEAIAASIARGPSPQSIRTMVRLLGGAPPLRGEGKGQRAKVKGEVKGISPEVSGLRGQAADSST
jgi:hypothetical protein